ncbi:MAG: DUF1585 domain-containing protein [Deltaproteobacteria bacterium]
MKLELWMTLGVMTALVGCNAQPTVNGNIEPNPIVDPKPDPKPDPDPMPDPDPVEPVPTFPVGTTPVGEAENCAVDQLSGPHVYGAKVKTLLTGLPLTSAELRTLKEDPEAIGELVEAWFDTPEAETVLRRFFMMAFQQDQVTGEGLMPMLKSRNIAWGRFDDNRELGENLMIKNIEESFARTALSIAKSGRPFKEVVTTDTFEMTTALMFFYAYLDHRHVRDDDTVFTRAMNEVADFTALRNKADEPPANQILNPNSPNFLRIWVPNFDQLCLANNVNEMAFRQNAIPNKAFWLFQAILGRMDNVRNVGAGNNCRARPARRNPLLTRADFNDWRPIRIRKAGNGETPIRFYRLPQLRNAEELALYGDRVGFFTTLGFFATWPTNEDNSSRVTLNQTLITALGESFDGQTVTDFSPPNLDAEHSAPGSPCYGCHQTLDPMREFFRNSYTNAYGQQHDQERIDLPATFVFRGVQQTGTGVQDLATILANHPDFARGWTQKLCYYANAAPCQSSAELERVIAAFEGSEFDFKVLIRELLASPLVTNAKCVDEKVQRGPSISRREQFCAQLSNRLGVADVCGIDTLPRERSGLQNRMLNAVGSIPADTVSRGEPEPITISETGLFTRATREVVCKELGERAYQAAFQGLNNEDAVAKMVTDVMGLPEGDPRHDPAIQILTEHVADGIDAGATPYNARRSALVVACMSPGVAGVGF